MEETEVEFYTFDELCESQDFEHNQEFVTLERYKQIECQAKSLALSTESYRSIIADLLFVTEGGMPRLPVTKSSICEKARAVLEGK